MGRGFLVGIFWGAVVSLVIVVALSLSLPPPARAPESDEMASDAAAASAPEAGPEDPEDVPPEDDGAEAGAAPADAEAEEPDAPEPETRGPDAPAADEPESATAPEESGGAEAVPEPGDGAQANAPGPDDIAPEPGETGAAQVPPSDGVPLPAGSEFNRPPPEQAAALPSTDSAPRSALPGLSGAGVPQAPGLPQVGDTGAPPQPEATAALSLPQVSPPDPGEAAAPRPSEAEDALAPPPELQPGPLGLPQIDTGPEAGAAPAARPEPEPAPEPAPAPAASAETPPDDPGPRLPVIRQGTGIVSPGDEPETTSAAEDAPADTGPPEDAPEGPAIVVNAAAFDSAETRPLMAVVLIDDPAFGPDRSALADIPFPVSFAVDPTRAGAAEAAAAYRAAGHEVLILADVLPQGAAPADVEVALAAAFDRVPVAVAVLDTETNRIQGDRGTLETVLGVIGETGHGLVAYPRGLNTAEQSAARQGVPAATLFRQIDADRERATVITRYLDRAAFAAGQEGAVIVVGRTYADTVTALYSWAIGGRSESVALAPVSAVLTR